MPIYEYVCGACGHQLDALQKVSEQPLIDCPACHHAALQKQMSATSFQLKGTGWYVTDFRNKTQKETSSGSQATESDAAVTTNATTSDTSTTNTASSE